MNDKNGSWTGNGYLRVKRPAHVLCAAKDGYVLMNRLVLFAAIGLGPHRCHWCRRPVGWNHSGPHRLVADHLDEDTANNLPTNVVASCSGCNSLRKARTARAWMARQVPCPA